MEQTFRTIYLNGAWGDNKDKLYMGSSGDGSRLEHALPYVEFVRKWLLENDIKSVVDGGCGDCQHFKPLYQGLQLNYVGYDIYKEMIMANNRDHIAFDRHFRQLDIYNQRDMMIEADVLILKDILQHWLDNEVVDFLDWATTCGKYKHILLTNCSDGRDNTLLLYRGGFRPLDEKHRLLSKYDMKPVFEYTTKKVLLWSAVKVPGI
jgi:hypothetical protein